MSNLLLQQIEKKYIKKKVPVLRPGYNVRVHQKIKEGEKERIQVFEGLVVAMNAGHGSSKTFTVRKVVQGIGVEKVFPVYSPLIAKIEIKKTLKTRRSKLNFLRKKGSVSKRLGAKLGLVDKDELYKKKKGLMEEEEVEEAVKADETAAPEEATTNTEEKEVKAEVKEEKKEEPKKEEEVKAEEKPKEEAPKKEEEVKAEDPKDEAKEERAHGASAQQDTETALPDQGEASPEKEPGDDEKAGEQQQLL